MDFEISKIIYNIRIAHMDFRHVTLSYTSTLLGLNNQILQKKKIKKSGPSGCVFIYRTRLQETDIFLTVALHSEMTFLMKSKISPTWSFELRITMQIWCSTTRPTAPYVQYPLKMTSTLVNQDFSRFWDSKYWKVYQTINFKDLIEAKKNILLSCIEADILFQFSVPPNRVLTFDITLCPGIEP